MKKQPCVAILLCSLISLTTLNAKEISNKLLVHELQTSPSNNEVTSQSNREIALPSDSESSSSDNSKVAPLSENASNKTIAKTEEFIIAVDSNKGAIIDEIISTMGKSSAIGLGFKKGHLKALGKKINDIGPLHFLGYIFSKKKLKAHMRNIRKSSLKWNGLIDGLKPGLNQASTSQEWEETLPGFAQTLNVNIEPLKEKADKRDWSGFVSYLVAN